MELFTDIKIRIFSNVGGSSELHAFISYLLYSTSTFPNFAPGGNNNVHIIRRPVIRRSFESRAERERFFRGVKYVEQQLLALFVNHELHRHIQLSQAVRMWAGNALSGEDTLWMYHREVEGHNAMVTVEEINRMVTSNRTRAMMYAANVTLANELLYFVRNNNNNIHFVDVAAEGSLNGEEERTDTGNYSSETDIYDHYSVSSDGWNVQMDADEVSWVAFFETD